MPISRKKSPSFSPCFPEASTPRPLKYKNEKIAAKMIENIIEMIQCVVVISVSPLKSVPSMTPTRIPTANVAMYNKTDITIALFLFI